MKRLIVAAALLLAACGQPEPASYTPEYQLNFMRACQSSGPSAAVCGCVWGKIEAEIPVADFLAFEEAPAAERASHPIAAQLRTMSAACAPTATPVVPAPEGTAP